MQHDELLQSRTSSPLRHLSFVTSHQVSCRRSPQVLYRSRGWHGSGRVRHSSSMRLSWRMSTRRCPPSKETRYPPGGGDPRSTLILGGGGGLGKIGSTIRIKTCHGPDQKVHLPFYEQHNKPMVLLNLVCCCDDNLSSKNKKNDMLCIICCRWAFCCALRFSVFVLVVMVPCRTLMNGMHLPSTALILMFPVFGPKLRAVLLPFGRRAGSRHLCLNLHT